VDGPTLVADEEMPDQNDADLTDTLDKKDEEIEQLRENIALLAQRTQIAEMNELAYRRKVDSLQAALREGNGHTH
jgi:hypothetical protein